MNFAYQKARRTRSEELIFNALAGQRRTFTELRVLTNLSKPVLSERLKELVRRGKLKKIYEPNNRRGFYQLSVGALRFGYIQRTIYSILSTQIFNDLFETAGKVSDKEFIERFCMKIGSIALSVMLIGLLKGKEDPDEGSRWIEETFGTLVQKYSWRRCLFRQILGGPYNLKHPVQLKEPLRPEFTKESGEILVKLPEAYEPGLTAKFLRGLPDGKRNRIAKFEASLTELYPDESMVLDKLFLKTQRAGR